MLFKFGIWTLRKFKHLNIRVSRLFLLKSVEFPIISEILSPYFREFVLEVCGLLRESEAGDFSVAGTSELRCPGLNLFATPCLPRRGGAAMHCRLQPSKARRGGLRYGATCHSPFSLHAWPCLGFYPWSFIDFCPLFLTNGPLFDAS